MSQATKEMQANLQSTVNRKTGTSHSKISHCAQAQTNICVEPACGQASSVMCRHCSGLYCELCFRCHRKHLIDETRSIREQMVANRETGIRDVKAFIDQQAKDAQDEAKKLVDDAIERIIRASKNIYSYIENRRIAKMGRLDECLEKFDTDLEQIDTKLSRKIFLSAEEMITFRNKYAYNMYDIPETATRSAEEVGKETPSTQQRQDVSAGQLKNEQFFDNYRRYEELINLRQRWTFLQAALTTVYYPAKKDISLDKVLTFLEYRHDRVLENYREHLASNEETKDLSLQSADSLLNGLSFLAKNNLPKEFYNFCFLSDMPPLDSLREGSEQTSEASTASMGTSAAAAPRLLPDTMQQQSNGELDRDVEEAKKGKTHTTEEVVLEEWHPRQRSSGDVNKDKGSTTSLASSSVSKKSQDSGLGRESERGRSGASDETLLAALESMLNKNKNKNTEEKMNMVLEDDTDDDRLSDTTSTWQMEDGEVIDERVRQIERQFEHTFQLVDDALGAKM